jgi:hypothetical protein
MMLWHPDAPNLSHTHLAEPRNPGQQAEQVDLARVPAVGNEVLIRRTTPIACCTSTTSRVVTEIDGFIDRGGAGICVAAVVYSSTHRRHGHCVH